MAKEENLKIEIIPEYGKYSFKQRLNRIDINQVVYSGPIPNAINYCSIHLDTNVSREQLEALMGEGYKYVIIKAV